MRAGNGTIARRLRGDQAWSVYTLAMFHQQSLIATALPACAVIVFPERATTMNRYIMRLLIASAIHLLFRKTQTTRSIDV